LAEGWSHGGTHAYLAHTFAPFLLPEKRPLHRPTEARVLAHTFAPFLLPEKRPLHRPTEARVLDITYRRGIG